jgi:hypothetical protein
MNPLDKTPLLPDIVGMSQGVVASINDLLRGMPLPPGIEWAENGDLVVFHQIPSTTFQAWLIVTPKPDDEQLIVSDALEIHIVTAANARNDEDLEAALAKKIEAHIARFVEQVASGTAHRIKDCEELPCAPTGS